MSLLIASWNVNSIRARLEIVLGWVKNTNPDIVLLQETKVQSPEFPKEPFEDLGYNIVLFGQKTYNGVAILSKRPLEDVHMGLPHEGDSQSARYIEAVTGGIRVASVYVPNGQSKESSQFAYKLNFFHSLKSHMETLLSYDETLILGGDFNVTPSDFDVHNPELWHEQILCTTEERQAFQTLIHLGLHDAIRLIHPKDPLYTWWDYRGASFQKNNGLRIDHFLVSPQAMDIIDSTGVDIDQRELTKTSDHAPIWISLRL